MSALADDALAAARNWAGHWMKPGIFIEWLGDFVSKVDVNKDYFGSE
jgi:hypothetical protein